VIREATSGFYWGASKALFIAFEAALDENPDRAPVKVVKVQFRIFYFCFLPYRIIFLTFTTFTKKKNIKKL
jgi:hypothetical protein